MTNPLITIVDDSEDLVLLAPGSSMDQHHPHMEGIAQTCHRVGLCTWRFQFDYRTEGKAFPPRDLSVTINEYEQAFEAASKAFLTTEYTLVDTVMALESLPTSLLICWTKPTHCGRG